jgi:hypothetical protein
MKRIALWTMVGAPKGDRDTWENQVRSRNIASQN